MTKFDWQVKRLPYSAALGVLVAITVHLKSPAGALVGFALFAVLTAVRFRTLGWNVGRAFIPLAVATAGTVIGLALGRGSPGGVTFATQSHAIALWAQFWMSIRAGISHAPGDPISPKAALARDLLAKRRQLMTTLKEVKPYRERHQQAAAVLTALNAERAAYVEAQGHTPTPELEALNARIAAQIAEVQPLGVESSARHERVQIETEALRAAQQAWKNRRQHKAA